MTWLELVIVSGTNTSEKYDPGLPVLGLTRYQARPLKFLTATGTAGSALVMVLPLLHAGVAGLLILMIPKYPLIVLNPGCVTMILVPMISMVGGVHAPVVNGLVGVLSPLT